MTAQHAVAAGKAQLVEEAKVEQRMEGEVGEGVGRTSGASDGKRRREEEEVVLTAEDSIAAESVDKRAKVVEGWLDCSSDLVRMCCIQYIAICQCPSVNGVGSNAS